METELKLDVAAADTEGLLRAPLLAAAGPAEERLLRSVYHDTGDQALRAAGLTVRVRADGDRHVQTVKAAGAAAGLFARPEWERDVPGTQPVVDETAGPLAGVLGGRALDVAFATEVRRARWLVAHEGASIEVALDRGEVRAGEAALPLSELELELKAGPVNALFDLAHALDAAVPLRLAVRAKSERGYLLAQGAAGRATRAEPIALDPDDTVEEAFLAIAQACLRQFRLNEALLLDGDAAPLPLHQARVGLRRLRSAFTLFKPLFEGDPRAGVLAGELRALAGVLGTVRDLDVLIEAHEGPVRDRLAEARAEAFGAARARLEQPATRRLMLDLAEWLAVGAWRTVPAEHSPVQETVAPFAAALLRHRRKRLKRRGDGLAKLDDRHRHIVRIEAKKLRYAAEFFAGLWRGDKARKRHRDFLEAIEALQEELGRLNDAATAHAVLGRLGLAGDAPPEKHGHGRRALKRAEHAFETLMEVKAFWR